MTHIEMIEADFGQAPITRQNISTKIISIVFPKIENVLRILDYA